MSKPTHHLYSRSLIYDDARDWQPVYTYPPEDEAAITEIGRRYGIAPVKPAPIAFHVRTEGDTVSFHCADGKFMFHDEIEYQLRPIGA